MNCVLLTIFNELNVHALYYFLESLFVFGNLSDDTEVLIQTNSKLKCLIEKSSVFTDIIHFALHDDNSHNIIDIPEKYTKILYLDTYCLISNSINDIFCLEMDDVLCAFTLPPLGTEMNEKSAAYSQFHSSILLFNNCQEIRRAIKETSGSMEDTDFISNFIQNVDSYKQNTMLLEKYAIVQTTFYDKKFALTHPINIFHYEKWKENIQITSPIKREYMFNVLYLLKDIAICGCIQNAKNYINENLLPIIKKSGAQLEGNVFMEFPCTNFEYSAKFVNKQKNIVNVSMNKNVKMVLEIGFNSGFSALLFLLANASAKIHCVDLCGFEYTLACYEKLRETFGERITLTAGCSTKVLSKIDKKFDLIHIDGCHLAIVAEMDIVNSYRLSKKGTSIIMDDYDFPDLHKLWDKYVDIYDLQPLDTHVYPSIYHDVKFTRR